MLSDFELIQEIFTLVTQGIYADYDQLSFEIFVHESYIETELILIKNSQILNGLTPDLDSSLLYEYVNKLRELARLRNEPWMSMKISHAYEAQVRVTYHY